MLITFIHNLIKIVLTCLYCGLIYNIAACIFLICLIFFRFGITRKIVVVMLQLLLGDDIAKDYSELDFPLNTVQRFFFSQYIATLFSSEVTKLRPAKQSVSRSYIGLSHVLFLKDMSPISVKILRMTIKNP